MSYSWLACRHVEDSGKGHQESALCHRPSVTQVSHLTAGMLKSRRDVIEVTRNWGAASRNPSRSPWPFQRLKSRALRMVAIGRNLARWPLWFLAQFSMSMWKVLCFYSCVEMTLYYLFPWCWTLKSPLGRYLSTALSPRSLTNPMGSVGGDSQTLHNQHELWDPNPILDHLKRWSQMILQYQVVYFPHVMICNVISFQSTFFSIRKVRWGEPPVFLRRSPLNIFF